VSDVQLQTLCLTGSKWAYGTAATTVTCMPERADAISDHAFQEDGGLRKRILVPGEGWETPEKSDEVTGTVAMGHRASFMITCIAHVPAAASHEMP
jgi:hypothetical protein